jgi:hypothetical protein
MRLSLEEVIDKDYYSTLPTEEKTSKEKIRLYSFFYIPSVIGFDNYDLLERYYGNIEIKLRITQDLYMQPTYSGYENPLPGSPYHIRSLLTQLQQEYMENGGADDEKAEVDAALSEVSQYITDVESGDLVFTPENQLELFDDITASMAKVFEKYKDEETGGGIGGGGIGGGIGGGGTGGGGTGGGDLSQNSDGMSPLAIAGIVIGVLIAMALIFWLMYFSPKRSSSRR